MREKVKEDDIFILARIWLPKWEKIILRRKNLSVKHKTNDCNADMTIFVYRFEK